MIITEAEIEQIVNSIESGTFQDKFSEAEPLYWHYLNSESFTSLTEEEHQLLFFINSVIYHACKDQLEDDYEFDIEDYQAFEEQNWGIRESTKSWEETVNEFFEGYDEEDLLAFIEDMLVDDETKTLTQIGKEVIFISSKSYVDFFLGAG